MAKKTQYRESVDTSVPTKIYGRIPGMLAKTFRTFGRRDKSTGVLLSGERGMGKSINYPRVKYP